MKILLVSDTTKNQVNGVSRYVDSLSHELQKIGIACCLLTADDFSGVSFPKYKEIKICAPNFLKFRKKLNDFNPDRIHIVTEGSVGIIAKLYCDILRIPYTTSYHTKFPELLHKLYRIPMNLGYGYFRWFHKKSKCVMTPTSQISQELNNKKFKNNIQVCVNGVDTAIFYPDRTKNFPEIITMLFVGRVSAEKNIEDFLKISFGYKRRKIVVGDGPDLLTLQKKYPDAIFTGSLSGFDLINIYQQANVFVFPSKSDTFGLVMLESLACGVPVASYPEAGAKEIIENCSEFKDFIFTHENLEIAVQRALWYGNLKNCVLAANKMSWKNSAKTFLKNTVTKHAL